MLSINQLTKIMELLSIPYDIKQKILMFFLSYGNACSSMIKIEIKDMNKFTRDYLRKPYTHKCTLWKYSSRARIFVNRLRQSNRFWEKYFPFIGYPIHLTPEDYNSQSIHSYELFIAYLTYHNPQDVIVYEGINNMTRRILALTKIRLNKMINEAD